MSIARSAAPLLCAALLVASPARADEPSAGMLAAARAVRALPCAGDAAAQGFTPLDGPPSPWRIARALVSVRRDEDGDRFAFVLAPPQGGSGLCAVREAIPLPREGEVLDCALADGSVRGLGVHTFLKTAGRRDVVFWRADGEGGLRRPAPGEREYESDTGELICTPPDPIP